VVIRSIDPIATADAVERRAFLMTSLLDGVAFQVHADPRGGFDEDERLVRAFQLLRSIAAGEC
jgi:hypothetical protein